MWLDRIDMSRVGDKPLLIITGGWKIKRSQPLQINIGTTLKEYFLISMPHDRQNISLLIKCNL